MEYPLVVDNGMYIDVDLSNDGHIHISHSKSYIPSDGNGILESYVITNSGHVYTCNDWFGDVIQEIINLGDEILDNSQTQYDINNIYNQMIDLGIPL